VETTSKIMQTDFNQNRNCIAGLRNLALVACVLIVVAIFLPVFPYSQSSSWFYGVGKTTVKADVSLTFLLFHCGAYVNANSTSTLLGVRSTSPASKGYNFNCNFRIVGS
jgi:hypothetical protein